MDLSIALDKKVTNHVFQVHNTGFGFSRKSEDSKTTNHRRMGSRGEREHLQSDIRACTRLDQVQQLLPHYLRSADLPTQDSLIENCGELQRILVTCKPCLTDKAHLNPLRHLPWWLNQQRRPDDLSHIGPGLKQTGYQRRLVQKRGLCVGLKLDHRRVSFSQQVGVFIPPASLISGASQLEQPVTAGGGHLIQVKQTPKVACGNPALTGLYSRHLGRRPAEPFGNILGGYPLDFAQPPQLGCKLVGAHGWGTPDRQRDHLLAEQLAGQLAVDLGRELSTPDKRSQLRVKTCTDRCAMAS